MVQLLRVAWRSVGRTVTRLSAEASAAQDRFAFAGLGRLGVDEISSKRGHRYLLVVVDNDSGRLVWAAAGRAAATLRGFFDLVGPSAAPLSSWSAPTPPTGSPTWSASAAPERCCLDPFHVVSLPRVFHIPHSKTMALLDDWLIWARRCRLPSFVKLARSIIVRRADIAASLRHGLSNARVESICRYFRDASGSRG